MQKTAWLFEKCGFSNSHILAGYFLKKYKEPVYDDGIPLTDMVYFKKRLEAEIDIKKKSWMWHWKQEGSF